MKETVWLFYIGIALVVFGCVGSPWIPTASVAGMVLGSLLTATSIVMHTFQQKQYAIQELASEVREAIMEQNSRINGLKDMVNGLDGDHQRLQAEVDKLDLDQLKKFESRLQFVENVSNVRAVMMNSKALKKEA